MDDCCGEVQRVEQRMGVCVGQCVEEEECHVLVACAGQFRFWREQHESGFNRFSTKNGRFPQGFSRFG